MLRHAYMAYHRPPTPPTKNLKNRAKSYYLDYGAVKKNFFYQLHFRLVLNVHCSLQIHSMLNNYEKNEHILCYIQITTCQFIAESISLTLSHVTDI